MIFDELHALFISRMHADRQLPELIPVFSDFRKKKLAAKNLFPPPSYQVKLMIQKNYISNYLVHPEILLIIYEMVKWKNRLTLFSDQHCYHLSAGPGV
jgi:hypothetical protein